jgi:hypothetical protein
MAKVTTFVTIHYSTEQERRLTALNGFSVDLDLESFLFINVCSLIWDQWCENQRMILDIKIDIITYRQDK